MARNHARLLTSIWNDDDFLTLSGEAQRIYMLLVSQQNLSHAGLLPLTVNRWANKAKNTSAEQIETALVELEERRYVITDKHTEELLVRSLVRRDDVWKHWKVLTAAVKDAVAIASPKLRSEMAREVARMLAFPDLSNQSRSLLEGLRDALPIPTDCQSEPEPPRKGQGYVTEVSTDGLPLPQPTSPAPTPAPSDFADDPTSQLLAEHVAAYSDPPPSAATAKVKVEIMRLVADRIPADRIRAGLARLRDKRVAASLLPQLVAECALVARPSTTDQRVATGLALVEKYREAEGR